MNFHHIFDYIQKNFNEEEYKVDLIQWAKDCPPATKSNNKLLIILDGENGLNRLYGGYYSDWICGGQWNRMRNFIKDLEKKLGDSKISMVVFFNGSLESNRMTQWTTNQKEEYKTFQKILLHVNKRMVPPPKAWWTAPGGIRMTLRMLLRQASINVICTTDDYHHEVIRYCREKNCYGIISDDPEFVAFNPSRLFSANQLKLTYKGSLETREYPIGKFIEKLQLNDFKLCILASLLGNHLMSRTQLDNVYKRAEIPSSTESESYGEMVIKKLAEFINNLNVSTGLDDVVGQILQINDDPQANILKESIQYYMNITKSGSYDLYNNIKSELDDNYPTESNLDTSGLVSEKKETEKSIEEDFTIDVPIHEQVNDDVQQKTLNNVANTSSENRNGNSKMLESVPRYMPTVSHDTMKTLYDRHRKGYMSPYLQQIISRSEIKLPVLLEDGKELPNIHLFYRPIRQMVYAIVFNLNHQSFMASKEKKPFQNNVLVKEWIFDEVKHIHKVESVTAVPLGWGVPTIQRLWFGTLLDDKRRRLRAFLTCMSADTPLIMNPDYVHQQLLIVAVVLRYIMSKTDGPILKKQELDAFIVAALAPETFDTEFTQQLKDPIRSHSVQLATLFMQGVEMAILVNDACGAPIPWLMCCPWLFFDGKSFNHAYEKSLTSKSLYELCGNRTALVMCVDRMRQAILENINASFMPFGPHLHPSQALITNADRHHPAYPSSGMLHHRMRHSPAMSMSSGNSARSLMSENGRGHRKSMAPAKLEVAGIPVSNWAHHHSGQHDLSPFMMPLPQSTAPFATNYHNIHNSTSINGYRPRLSPSSKGKSSYKQPYPKKKTFRKDKKPHKNQTANIASTVENLKSTEVDVAIVNGVNSISLSDKNSNKLDISPTETINGITNVLSNNIDTCTKNLKACEAASSSIEVTKN